jgi:hypothetical protein
MGPKKKMEPIQDTIQHRKWLTMSSRSRNNSASAIYGWTIIASNSMYAIYQNAYLTVVDGPRSNRQNGLFGVSNPRTRCQTTAQLAGQQWMSTLRNPQTLIQGSPWITRGWTYQEAIASPRLLIFTEEQVYFECKAMRCWESTHIPLDTHHRKGKTRFRDNRWEPIFCQYTRNATEFEGR